MVYFPDPAKSFPEGTGIGHFSSRILKTFDGAGHNITADDTNALSGCP
jgi:hypothetical protein